MEVEVGVGVEGGVGVEMLPWMWKAEWLSRTELKWEPRLAENPKA